MEKKKISMIAAIAQNYAIGSNNQLLWHIPEELKHFKEITIGHPVIMGRKTYDSLHVKPLPNRRNIVITNNTSLEIEGCEMANSVEAALKLLGNREEAFVIGGGEVYKQFIPYANTLYITWVYQNFDAHTYFPEINSVEWNIVDQSEIYTAKGQELQYAYFKYERRIN